MSITYKKVSKIEGPLIFLKPIPNHRVEFGSKVIIKRGERESLGQVIVANKNFIIVEVFEGTQGLSKEIDVTFENEVFKIGVSREMLGGVFDGLGEPKGEPFLPEKYLDINGSPINPVSRAYPKDVIQTGISTIDGLNTLVRGQKLPIFSGQGLPHNELAAQIVNNAKVKTKEKFITIFCGIGLLADEALFFQETFREHGIGNIIQFVNLASDPSMERLLVPRVALSTAEFFAFTHEYHVLVVMVDMTNYADALRELSNTKEEIPARKGFPGYMYSDFASIYERAGRIRDNNGSITQIPIITMPDDDITHPIPDLTGYITEGQIVLSREYHQKGLFPPVDILSSLSRLMKDGVGEGNTREDHQDMANQLYAIYSKSQETRQLESIIGEENLSEHDKAFLTFADLFELNFIDQGKKMGRQFSKTFDIGWKLLSLLGRGDLTRMNKDYIDEYYQSGISENDFEEVKK